MISAQVRYDADVNAVAETTKFYYDGSNVIAEHDMADVIQRRYVHGKRGIDERAVELLEGRMSDHPPSRPPRGLTAPDQTLCLTHHNEAGRG